MPPAIAALAAVGAGIGAATLAPWGVGTLGFALVSSAVSMGASYGMNELFGLTPDVGELGPQHLKANIVSSVAPIPVVYGSRRVGGTIAFAMTTGENGNLIVDNAKYMHLIVALCEGEIDSIGTVYFDDKDITGDQYSGHCNVQRHTGTDTQEVEALLHSWVPWKWDDTARLKGVAYLYVRMAYDPDVYSGGIPVITADVVGKKVYNPDGGATAYSDSPSLCTRDFLTNTRYGCGDKWGITAANIDDDAIETATDFSAEQVSVGGVTQDRYTCDGVLDTSRDLSENVRALLSSCNGMLVWTDGVYRLVIPDEDKPAAPDFTFDEDSIIGEWQINFGSKRNTFNRCEARYYNAAKTWEPDIAPVDSSANRVFDNDLLLTKTIGLPFTDNEGTAKQLATLALNQSRYPIVVSLTATIKALTNMVGEIVYITHATPGWTAKEFRIILMGLKDTGEVRVTLMEYADDIYDFSTVTLGDGAQTTDLPDPFTVGVPGQPIVTESTYQTMDGSGVKTRVTVEWSAPTDSFVHHYELQYKQQLAFNFYTVARTETLEYVIYDIEPGYRYNFRVRAEHALGPQSEWSTITSFLVEGIPDKPSDVTGFSGFNLHGFASLSWDRPSQTTDLDVIIGGNFRIKYVLDGGTVNWDNGILIRTVAGSETTTIVPSRDGTYLIKAVNSGANESAGYDSWDNTDYDDPFLVTSVDTITIGTGAGDSWTALGTFSDTEDTGAADYDLRLPESGGAVTTLDGSWTQTSGTLDAGAGAPPYHVRASVDVDGAVVDVQTNIDDRTGDVDDWPDWDGGTGTGAAWAEIWERHADTAVALASATFNRFINSGDYYTRFMAFKVVLHSEDPKYNYYLDNIAAEMVTYDSL